MVTQKTVRILGEDVSRLRNDVKKEFLKHNPKFKGMKLSDPFIINKMIDYYLDIFEKR